MPSKEDLEKLKDIFEEEQERLFLTQNIICELDGYDRDVRTVFIIEDEASEKPLTHELLKPFTQKIKEQINKNWDTSIKYTDIESWRKQNKRD